METSAENLIEAYEDAEDQNKQWAKENKELQSKYEKIETKYGELESKHNELESKYSELEKSFQRLKDFLLQDNRYADKVDDLVVVKTTSDKLSTLYEVESKNYEVVDTVRDLYGDVHSVSYKFHPYNVAFATYMLKGQYDTFNASVATTSDTGNDVKMSVEIYVDDEGEPRKRIDNITRGTNLEQLGTVVITGANKMTIKVITTEGNGYYGGVLYITDDSLSVVQ